jgi:hypothetical protein
MTTLEEIEFAKRLFRYWRQCACAINGGVEKSSYSDTFVNVALCLLTKAERLFKSIRLLCESRDSTGAQILVRSLFETLLATAFVHVSEFRPGCYKGDGTLDSEMGADGKDLTKEFRSELFYAFHFFKPYRQAAQLGKKPRKAAKAAQLAALIEPKDETKWENKLGAVWLDRVKNVSYSGLKIRNLAHSLGIVFEEWYDELYPSESSHAHATDMESHVYLDTETDRLVSRIEDDDDDVRQAMSHATSLFFTCIRLFMESFDIGEAVNLAIHNLEDEHIRLVNGSEK